LVPAAAVSAARLPCHAFLSLLVGILSEENECMYTYVEYSAMEKQDGVHKRWCTICSVITYLMKHLICTTCWSHRNDHRTSSIDCDLHKLMNNILCELRNLKDLLSLSPLIIIN